MFLLGVAIVITPPGHKKVATPLVVTRNELGLKVVQKWVE